MRDSTIPIETFISDDRSGIAAWVIHRSPYTLARQWTIDQGRDDGIILGSIAYVGDSVIGSVTKVFDTTSQITPFFTPGIKTQVVHVPSGMSLVVEGHGQGIYYTEVPRDFIIAQGDYIQWQKSASFTLMGEVKGIVFDERDALQKIFFALPVNPKTIQWVEIVKPEDTIL